MLGWESCATAWDSALKRRRNSSSCARSALQNLDGHQAVEAVALCLVDHRHAARCRCAPESHSGCPAFFQCIDPSVSPPSHHLSHQDGRHIVRRAAALWRSASRRCQTGVRILRRAAPQRASPDPSPYLTSPSVHSSRYSPCFHGADVAVARRVRVRPQRPGDADCGWDGGGPPPR